MMDRIKTLRNWEWLEDADYIYTENSYYLGVDEDGEIFVPDREIDEHSGIRFSTQYNPKNPTHWKYWLTSFISNMCVPLERY